MNDLTERLNVVRARLEVREPVLATWVTEAIARIATLEAEKAERERYMAVRLADFEQRYNYRTVSPNTVLDEVTDGVAYEREHGLDSNL